MSNMPIETSIAPWLAVGDGARAVEFYVRAFGAAEVYRLDNDAGGIAVAQLTLGRGAFWVQEDHDSTPSGSGRLGVRMIVTIDDPDAAFARAVAAGATEVFGVSDQYGWRTGRLTDPFGYDWEFSKPLS
jgi:PhnB protein